jgi:1-deoxy-D-xylulose-5-phosphate synthase
VIGDGALTAGVPMEALYNAGALNKNLLIILNHNQMSISKNVGALSTYLDKVRTATFYREAKKEISNLLSLVPIGKELESTVNRFREAIKRGIMPAGTIFEELGLSYFGPVDGHNMKTLVEELAMVKELEGPVLLHVVTEKGHGFDYASKDPVTYHSPTAFAKEDGELTKKTGRPSYSSAFATTLISMAEDDPRIVAITAAMAQGTALDKFGERFPERLFDVGIAEQHAVAFSTGLAKSGMRPVAAIYSTFLQRAYDQVFQEVCLQDQPVVFAIDRAGITGGDGATAQGNFDIAYLRTLPRISIMAPRNGSELNLMMRYAMESTGPIAIRYPRESIPKEELDDVPAPIEHGRGELLREGEDLALFALGAMVIPALEAAEALEEEGISAAVIRTRRDERPGSKEQQRQMPRCSE